MSLGQFLALHITEGHLPREHEIQQNPRTPHVDRGSSFLNASRPMKREVASQYLLIIVAPFVESWQSESVSSAGSKVHKPKRPSIAHHHDVVTFDVSMDDACAVNVRHNLCHLLHNVGCQFMGHRRRTFLRMSIGFDDEVMEGAPNTMLHHHKHRTIEFHRVQESYNERMRRAFSMDRHLLPRFVQDVWCHHFANHSFPSLRHYSEAHEALCSWPEVRPRVIKLV